MTSAALWLQPALVAALALRVAAGEADAPLLVLAALLAPLMALLAPPGPAAATNPVATVAAGVAMVVLLAANFSLAADAATLLGGVAWHGVVAAAGLAVLLPLSSPARRLDVPALVLGTAALLLPLVAVTVVMATSPWAAWSRGGWRPALTFSEASAWVQDGERFARPVRLAFSEGQRVTALTAGVYRVVERDATPAIVRDWHLGAGETLTLRPGDELSVAAGARLRFEAGRRVPGAPASGVAWADPPGRASRMLPVALGGLVTIVGGALALVPAATQRGVLTAATPVVLLAGVIAATGWGVYAGASAADLTLSGSPLAPLLGLPPLALGARGGAMLAILVAGGIGLLLVGGTIGLRRRLAGVVRPDPTLWAGAVALAAALTVWPLDSWRLFTLALGVAAAGWTPARLAPTRGAGLAGCAVGALAFAALGALPLLSPPLAATLDGVVRYPALVALPLGWVTARVAAPLTARDDSGGVQ